MHIGEHYGKVEEEGEAEFVRKVVSVRLQGRLRCIDQQRIRHRLDVVRMRHEFSQ